MKPMILWTWVRPLEPTIHYWNSFREPSMRQPLCWLCDHYNHDPPQSIVDGILIELRNC